MKPFLRIDSISCGVASGRDELKAAFELIYQRYLVAGLTRPNRTGLRIADYQLGRGCEILVAKRQGEVVGTVSLVGESAGSLPLESTFPMALLPLRERDLSLVEIGCLAAIDGHAGTFSPIFAALTRAAILHARQSGFDRMVATVHPRHARFYQRSMGFECLSEPVSYASVEGHLAVCVAGDPRESSAYRSPWREIFFSSNDFVRAPRGCMSPADRRYFMAMLFGSQARCEAA